MLIHQARQALYINPSSSNPQVGRLPPSFLWGCQEPSDEYDGR